MERASGSEAAVVAGGSRRQLLVDGTARLDLVEHATRVFSLSPLERDVLLILLAASLGPAGAARALRVGDLIDAVTKSADVSAVVAALDDVAPLLSFALIEVHGDGPRINRGVALHDDFWPRLVGASRAAATLGPGEIGLDRLALAPLVAARVATTQAWLRGLRGRWATVIVHGPAGSGRGALAAGLAAELGCGVLPIEGGQLTPMTLPAWRRDIAWHQAVPVVTDAERADPASLTALARLAACPLFATASSPIVERVLGAKRAVHTLEVDPLTAHDRAAIWRCTLARAGAASDAVDVGFLGARFAFAPARIVAASIALVDDVREPTTDAAVAICRSIPEVRVGALATRIATPYRWNDLVVTPAVRAELELIATWGRRGAALFGPDAAGGRARAPRGLACLFHGPPGTGKSLAAQVVAGELGLELYRVDLAQVVDKYIGETEKRLDLLFREAEAAGVVLFFDEADALFTQRTEVREARDRYANLETGFLLQRLEDHAGLTILATNLQRNLDAAFQRRLSVVVELPLPGPIERARIWDKLLPPPALRADDIDIELLARRVTLAGGEIRNAVVAAVLIAERDGEALAGKHLAIAVWREMMKAGRLFDPVDLGPWRDVVVAYAGAQRR
jgi:AAA+ superfamily predicted ATPase